MSFNPFRDRWPFGRTSTGYPHSLKDLAEDVSFEEVKEPAKKTIDKAARTKQLADEIQSKTSDLMKQNPIQALHVVVMFSAGAHWADEHSVSDFPTTAERNAAMRKEITRMLEVANEKGERNIMFDAISTALFANGAHWADENPAPTIN